MPARESSERTGSEGCAPTLIQYLARSPSIWIVDGSVSGLYQPMFSMVGRRAVAASKSDDAALSAPQAPSA
jgi:hypothetical protein